MKKEELEIELKKLELDYENRKRQLLKEFCDKNNPYKIGDIFTDHIGSIKIERIKYSLSLYRGNPCCVYCGIELKKDLTPKKIQTIREAWQSNDIKNESK